RIAGSQKLRTLETPDPRNSGRAAGCPGTRPGELDRSGNRIACVGSLCVPSRTPAHAAPLPIDCKDNQFPVKPIPTLRASFKHSGEAMRTAFLIPLLIAAASQAQLPSARPAMAPNDLARKVVATETSADRQDRP